MPKLPQPPRHILDAFWRMPESQLVRDGTHIALFADQRDPSTHGALRRLGAEPNPDPSVEPWMTLVLPPSDFNPAVRVELEKMRAPDTFPGIYMTSGYAVVVPIPDGRAQRSN